MNREVYWHILFWVVYMSIFTFVEGGYSSRFNIAFYMELGFLPFRLVVVYLNYFWLLPKYLLNRNIKTYLGYTLICIAIASFLHRAFMYYYLNGVLFPDWDPGGFPVPYKLLQSAMIITSPMIFLIGMVIMKRWVSSEKRAEQLANEKVKAELSYLRSQINPHFFFNTLNTLYGLSLKKSDRTPEVVIKLSELMSYVLYDADKEFIASTKEIEQIERYIDLERIRYKDRFQTEWKIEGDPDEFQIPPLILLPFVENSFKHGVNKSEKDGWISISIQVSERALQFTIKNKVAEGRTLEKTDKSGVGVSNVQRRLRLLFPDQHELEYGLSADIYTVALRIWKS